MKRSKSLSRGLAIGLALLCGAGAGCIPSLHPIYTDADLMFDPGVVGAWRGAEGDTNGVETLEFTAADRTAYRLVYTDKEGLKGTFAVHLVRIGENLFFDVYPDRAGAKVNGYYQMHEFPVHTFAWVRQIRPELKCSFMSGDWLDKLLKATPTALRHERVDDAVLISARTAELKAFLAAHVKTPGAFGEPSVWTPVGAPPAGRP